MQGCLSTLFFQGCHIFNNLCQLYVDLPAAKQKKTQENKNTILTVGLSIHPVSFVVRMRLQRQLQ
jgi:hypothetical protein